MWGYVFIVLYSAVADEKIGEEGESTAAHRGRRQAAVLEIRNRASHQPEEENNPGIYQSTIRDCKLAGASAAGGSLTVSK